MDEPLPKSDEAPVLEPGPLGNIVKAVLLVVIGLMWSLLGLIFWIAVLFRACALFSAALVYSVFTKEGIGPVGRQLDAAVSLYPYGFRVIGHQLRKEPAQERTSLNISMPATLKLVVELLWVVFFWGSILYLLEQYGVLRPVISPMIHDAFSAKK